MTRRTKTALQDFTLPEQEALFAVMRLHDWLQGEWARFFGAFDITMQQYNVLRVLYVRDDGEGLACQHIGARLITRVPDITRLLDRLVKRGLVERVRDEHDRRVVRARLTEAGWDLVERIHEPSLAYAKQQWAHLDAAALVDLVAKLRQARGPSPDERDGAGDDHPLRKNQNRRLKS